MNIVLGLLCVLVPVGVVVLLVLAALTVRLVPGEQRLVVTRGGQPAGTRGPGLTLVLPFMEKATAVDLREKMRSWETFGNPTRDGGRIAASLDYYVKVADPRLAATPTDDSLLQAVVIDAFAEQVRGQTLAEVLHDPQLAEAVRGRVAERAGAWGLAVTLVKVRGLREG